MNLQNLSKTLFTIYRHLEKLANALDKLIEVKAMNCMSPSSVDIFDYTSLTVADKIIKLSNKKVGLINLKIIANKLLQSIDKKYARLLIARYIDNQKLSDIAKSMFISERTAVRWLQSAFVQCEKFFKTYEYYLVKVEDVFNYQPWIKDIYDKYNQNTTSISVKFTNIEVFRSACLEYKHIMQT